MPEAELDAILKPPPSFVTKFPASFDRNLSDKASMDCYKFPTPHAVQTLNALFELPAHGREQDWEIELADGTRIAEFLAALSDKSLDLECRSALALLILHSLTYAGTAEVTEDMAAATKRIIHGDREVYERMLSYWSDGFLDHENLVRSVLR